jgi:hypothetical protein
VYLSFVKKKWYSSFAEWNTPAVEEAFGLKCVQRSAGLPHLLQLPAGGSAPPAGSAQLLEQLRQHLILFSFGWNDYELMAGFIAPLLATVSFVGKGFALFHQRLLSLKDQGQVSEGKVYRPVAFGRFSPEIPFFFFHEYKKSQGTDADPEGQPLYGCYVVGSYWRFVLLEGQTYSVSQGYDATDAGELRIIWSVLMHTKQRIEERVQIILDSES